jgi:hypothetical protein
LWKGDCNSVFHFYFWLLLQQLLTFSQDSRHPTEPVYRRDALRAISATSNCPPRPAQAGARPISSACVKLCCFVSNSIVRSQQRWARRLRSSPPIIIDQLGSDTAGHYVKLTLSLSRLRQLTRSDALYFGFSGQTSNKNLDTSEQFYLGGPAGIKRSSRGRLAC